MLIWLPTRRRFLFGTASLLASACTSSRIAPQPVGPQEPSPFVEMERRVGGRLGVFALDTGSGRSFSYRADDRFAMCSTFKWVLAAAVLARVDQAQLSLDTPISYGPADLLDYAPITREHVAEGAMAVVALARAAVVVSDNTAANLLLTKLGGPSEITGFVRSLGDAVTRLDRNEPSLNTNEPGDPRDTSSPRAMVHLMRQILCEDVLLPASQEQLLGWLRDCETGKARLRAGFPTDWSVGDKTGSGAGNAINDVAIAVPPGRAPILLAVYMSGGDAGTSQKEAVHAELARLSAQEFSHA